jgi:hypothetical protein
VRQLAAALLQASLLAVHWAASTRVNAGKLASNVRQLAAAFLQASLLAVHPAASTRVNASKLASKVRQQAAALQKFFCYLLARNAFRPVRAGK